MRCYSRGNKDYVVLVYIGQLLKIICNTNVQIIKKQMFSLIPGTK